MIRLREFQIFYINSLILYLIYIYLPYSFLFGNYYSNVVLLFKILIYDLYQINSKN